MLKKYYIKERNNPQLGTYYVACGQLTVEEAKIIEKSVYGTNFMLKFDTKEEYDAKIRELKIAGHKIDSEKVI